MVEFLIVDGEVFNFEVFYLGQDVNVNHYLRNNISRVTSVTRSRQSTVCKEYIL